MTPPYGNLVRVLEDLPPAGRVAVDGVDCAGKTTFADVLAAAHPGSRRLSVDDFLLPVGTRYRRGRLSPEGCYRDTHDLTRFRQAAQAPTGLLIADGVFLNRPELADLWDLVVLLVIDDGEVLRRARRRDPGDPAEVERRYRTRYLPAQRLYRAEASAPDVVIDNTDPHRPVRLR